MGIIIFTNIVYAQQYIVKGKLVNQDKESVEPVLANLFSNKLLIQTLSTDSTGLFSFTAANGTYEVVLEQSGKKYYHKTIQLNGNLDLGDIQINESSVIEGINLTGRKKLIERKVDRIVFNVENATSIAGGNALDALKITPRVKVQNDQISMIGKGGMKLMVNDKLVQLSDEDLANYLKTLNAEDLKKIEVITTPPSKYVAEGNSGIINIVTKTSKNQAWNSSIRSAYQQATYSTGSVGGSFNLQKGKLDLSSAINYINGSNAPTETSTIYYPANTWDIYNNRRDYTDNFSVRFGASYKITEKLKTGFSINHVYSTPLIKDNESTKIYSLNNQLDSLIATNGRNNYEKKLTSFNYHVIYEMDSIGRKLSLDVDFFKYKNSTDRLFQTQSFLANAPSVPHSFDEARNNGVQDIENYSVNVDMEHPLKWIDLNYGGRLSQIKTDNSFNYFQIENNEEILDVSQSNIFTYKENIYAAYISGHKNFNDKWEAKLGLRYERTNTEGFSATVNQINKNHYQKFFPTLYVSYTLNDKNKFNINYSKRIKRPSYNFLNPFRFVSNPYSYSEGNPYLQPAFTDNFEFEYTFKDNLITNIYFSRTDDNFEQVTILNKETSVQQVIPKNFIINKMFGINQTAIYKLMKWWDVNISADIYYSDTNSKIPETLQFLSGWNGEFNISNDFVLNRSKTLMASVNYNYTTTGVSNLDHNSSSNQLDASIKWMLLNKKMVVSFYCNDIFSSNRTRYTSYSNNIKNSFRNYYDERFFRLGIVYNFGKKINNSGRELKNKEDQDRTN